MNIALQRAPFTAEGTPGKLSVSGEPFCFTLERSNTDVLHPCIPAGTYRVLLQYSPHFGRPMPHLQDVPGRTDILIHWGNFVMDSKGCILVGDKTASMGASGYFLPNSRTTFDKLYQEIQDAQTEGIEIEIVDAVGADDADADAGRTANLV